MDLPREWVEKAEFFRREVKRHLGENVYWIVCFEAQQAVELYLRALAIKLTGLYEFTHDLSKLLKYLEDAGLKILGQLYVYADALTPHYTLARYPGSKPIEYDEAVARRCIEYMEKIVGWILSEAEGASQA